MSFEHERPTEEQDSSLYQITDSLMKAIGTAPSGKPETFGATPLNHGAAYQQQLSLRLELEKLLDNDIAKKVPQEIVEYMKDTFVSRFVGRGNANHEHYLSALRPREEVDQDPLVQDMITRSELGHASPSEILVTQQLTGIPSVVLACLTHSYGQKIELLEPMLDAVKKNVELLGGVIYDNPDVRFKVKGVIGGHRDYSQGVLMTRKRILGTMPDGTIICERHSFVLRLDDEFVVPMGTDEAIEEAVADIDPASDEWQTKAVTVGRLDEIAIRLLEGKMFTHAIPVSTTIYAYNLETARLVKEKKKLEREARGAERAEFESKYPSIAEARQAERLQRELSNRAVKNIDGMLFIGHADLEVYGDNTESALGR